MAEVAAWAEAPARAIGRLDVRTAAQVAGRDVGERGQRAGARGHPHRHVRQRHGRGRPLPPRPPAPCPDPQHAGLPGRQLHLPRALLAGQRPLPGLRPGLARGRHHVQGAGRHRHHVRPPPRPLRAARRRAPPPRQGVEDRDRRSAGSRGWPWPTARRSPHRWWSPTSTPPPPSPSCSTATPCPRTSAGGSRPSTTGRRTSRCTSPSTACPSTPLRTTVLNEGDLRHNVTFFGTAEEMQRDFEGCVRGIVPDVPVLQPVDPEPARPVARPGRQARGQQLRLLFADRGRPRRPGRASAIRWPTASWPRSPPWPPTSPT